MAHVFVSYARSDEAVAAELERALIAAGFSTFLDVHPSSGIAAGTDWLDELHRELSRAGCLLYLSSAASAASPWCQAELLNAYWAGKPVIPVQLDDTDPPLMQRIQVLKMTESPGGGTAQVLDLLNRWFPYSASARPVSRTTNPYPGLRSFGESEAELFFGRSDLAEEIVRRLTAPRASPEEFMLAISGPSGCGKSSLVRAAVLPLLRARHDGVVCVGPLEPGTMSCEAIRALARSSSPQDLGPRAGLAVAQTVRHGSSWCLTRRSASSPGSVVKTRQRSSLNWSILPSKIHGSGLWLSSDRT